ncbi:MAG: glycosyltransferase [Deltaproteobacteria bacterium]|nr:glycosyltransferase [Deltaproteobacteria bacterium]
MKVLFIAYDGILTQSVFESQIVKPLELLSKDMGADCRLVAFESIAPYFKRLPEIGRKREEIERRSGVKCLFLPRIPGFCGLMFTAFALPFLMKTGRVLGRDESAIIHSRGSKGCFIGLGLKRSFPGAGVVFDARASEPEQYVSDFLTDGPVDLDKLPRDKARLYEKTAVLEARAARGADHIFSQCEELKKSLMTKYGVPGRRFTVFPNAVSVNKFSFDAALREKVRNELGIEKRLVLVYSGSINSYQLPERGVQFFKRLKSRAPESFFLAMTFDPERMSGLLAGAGVDKGDYKVMKLGFADVPRYTLAGDAGLLLRVQNEYSRTSAPVKLAEYLSAGLFIVTLDGIGDASPLVRRHGAGIVLPDAGDESLENGAAMLASMSDKLASTCEKRRIAGLVVPSYSQEHQIPEKYRCYQRLLKNRP